jgi:hypothetical protein
MGFIPSKEKGVILLCSCDTNDVDMNNLGFVLLNLSGIEILDKDMDFQIQSSTTPFSSDKYS